MSRTHHLLMTRVSGSTGNVLLPREVSLVLSKVSADAFVVYHHLRTLSAKNSTPADIEPSAIAEALLLDEEDITDWIHDLMAAGLVHIDYFNNVSGEIAHLIVGSTEVATHLNTLKGNS